MNTPVQEQNPLHHIFWGKIDMESGRSLPLAAHCLDVALVFRSLCELDGFRRALNGTAGPDGPLSASRLDRLAVLAMLHDAGKANLGFQMKVFDPRAPRAGHIRELAPILDMDAPMDPDLHRAFITALPREMEGWFADGESAYSFLMASFSHHGKPLVFQGEMPGTFTLARDEWWHPRESWDPMAAVAEITRWSRHAFPGAYESGGPPLPRSPRFQHRFAGLVMLADWLASHEYWFPVEATTMEQRLLHSRRTVPALLRAVGLDAAPHRAALGGEERNFLWKFGFKTPRPLQAAVDALDPGDENTRLVIAEAETGSGKTEAALSWFFKLFTAGEVDGLYFALPTRVAAREIYTRVNTYVTRWFRNAAEGPGGTDTAEGPGATDTAEGPGGTDTADKPVTLLAVPGYALVDDLPPEKLMPGEEHGRRWDDDPVHRARERQWAAEHPKRFLAATVAVGTIDQALLSAVQAAHAHLRSVCLDRTLLVVDEVHASDIYMTRLLENLLDHHLSVGGRALLMSATLGSRSRGRFTGERDGQRRGHGGPPACGSETTAAEAVQAPYPSLTLADGTMISVSAGSVTAGEKAVTFDVLPYALSPEKAAPRILKALAAGARVLVIMNTVGRANEMLRRLEAAGAAREVNRGFLFQCRGIVCPHHGRFAPADRAELDRQVTNRFGAGSPPGPVVIVGTQTLEQSLDIDADVIFTDLAPMDVLLQRVGRLHRHRRPRPEGFQQARCFVFAPEKDLEAAIDGRGQVSGPYPAAGFGSVYEDLRTLELTRRLLHQNPAIVIPRDNRRLVEGATHPEFLADLQSEPWRRHGQVIEGGDTARKIAAVLAATTFDKPFGDPDSIFNEPGGRVAVRLGAGSLQLPLNQQVKSPFGRILSQIVIPHHMAPGDPPEEVTAIDGGSGEIIFHCGDRTYEYTRFGLEVRREPSQ